MTTLVHIISLALFAQTAPPVLQGVVVKAGTNDPIVKATVELRRSDDSAARTYSVITTKEGRFAFDAVPPGQYQLTVTRPGYVKATHGERRLEGPGTPIVLPGEAPPNVRLVMTPTGVISGRILDRTGQPLGNATVYAMKASSLQGTRASSNAVQTAPTNDLGEYRLFWLTPGRYYVGAEPTVGSRRSVSSVGMTANNLHEFRFQSEATTTRPRETDEIGTTVYFPGTLERGSATPLDVKPGEEVRGVDFFAAPVRTRHIRGVVVNAETGQQLTGSPTLRLTGEQSNRMSGSSTTAFDMSGVFPGKYIFSAELNGMYGSVPVEVRDQDLDNVVVRISRGFTLSGRIVIDGASAAHPTPDVKTLRVAFRPDPANGLNPNVQAGADGSFTVQSLYSGNYHPQVNLGSSNAYVKSIQFENRDVLNTGVLVDGPPSSAVTIVVNANAGIVTGTVLNEKQAAVPNAIVVLVPQPDLRARTQLFKNVTSDAKGQFRIQAITPGAYKLFAWEEVETGAWLNADFMRTHEERGLPVRIAEGQTVTLSLPPIVD